MEVVAFLHKREDLTRAELIAHYEGHHVPLILSLGPAPVVYQRTYLDHAQAGADGSPRDEPDVITQLSFVDRAAYEAWVAAMYAPGSGVAADEETFLDRSRTRSFAAETRRTP